MTNPDYSKVVEALEDARSALNNHYGMIAAGNKCKEVLPLAIELVEKAEAFDDIMASNYLKYIILNSYKADIMTAILAKKPQLNRPTIIKKLLEEGK